MTLLLGDFHPLQYHNQELIGYTFHDSAREPNLSFLWGIADQKADKIIEDLDDGQEPLNDTSQLRANILKDFID